MTPEDVRLSAQLTCGMQGINDKAALKWTKAAVTEAVRRHPELGELVEETVTAEYASPAWTSRDIAAIREIYKGGRKLSPNVHFQLVPSGALVFPESGTYRVMYHARPDTEAPEFEFSDIPIDPTVALVLPLYVAASQVESTEGHTDPEAQALRLKWKNELEQACSDLVKRNRRGRRMPPSYHRQ